MTKIPSNQCCGRCAAALMLPECNRPSYAAFKSAPLLQGVCLVSDMLGLKVKKGRPGHLCRTQVSLFLKCLQSGRPSWQLKMKPSGLMPRAMLRLSRHTRVKRGHQPQLLPPRLCSAVAIPPPRPLQALRTHPPSVVDRAKSLLTTTDSLTARRHQAGRRYQQGTRMRLRTNTIVSDVL